MALVGKGIDFNLKSREGLIRETVVRGRTR